MEVLHEVFDPTGPEFWVLVATVAFLAIVWKLGGFRQLTAALDARANRIRRELKEAADLRADAQKLLADYERRAKEAESEALAIIAAAKTEAERFKAEAIAKAQEFIARRTKMAEQKIAQAESQAVSDVRMAAADAAVGAASKVLAAQMTGPGGADQMRAAIGEVRKKLN